jgi:hypothetical protein
MKEVLDIQKISNGSLHNVTMTYLENVQTIHRRIVTKIVQLSNQYKFNRIKTNVKVLAHLQDTSSYNINPINSVILNSTQPQDEIIYGSLCGIDVYLDFTMKWDDDRIIPIYDPMLLRSYKINKIKGNKIYFDILDELKIENLEI